MNSTAVLSGAEGKPSSPASHAETQSRRIVSLDVFRGLAVAGMILVTDPGTYSAVYRPLLHADWNGWTPTDLIFPAFLFAVGASIPLSFDSRAERGEPRVQTLKHVLVRSVAVFTIGLLVNGFPDYNMHTIRIPGILQRIAVCYLCAAILYLGSLKHGRWQATTLTVITVLLLLGYWAILRLVPSPGLGRGRLDAFGNIAAYVDRALFSVRHLWPYGTSPGHGVSYDPEGLLSTLPAIASVLIGAIAGIWLGSANERKRKVFLITLVGIVLIGCGLLLNPLLPINKKLWTPTFALFSSGTSLVFLGALYAALDLKQWRRWTSPALIFGKNAMLAFVVSSVITAALDRIRVRQPDGVMLSIHKWLYSHWFVTWLHPIHASLAYAIAIVLLNMTLLYPLYRRRIFVRI